MNYQFKCMYLNISFCCAVVSIDSNLLQGKSKKGINTKFTKTHWVTK